MSAQIISTHAQLINPGHAPIGPLAAPTHLQQSADLQRERDKRLHELQMERDAAQGKQQMERDAANNASAQSLMESRMALSQDNDLAKLREGARLNEEAAISAQGRKDMSALNSDIANAVMSGRFSADEMKALEGEADVAKKRIMFADMFREKEPTPADTFAKNTFTDQNGVVFARDGSKMIYDPNAAKAKQQEAEDTRYQNAILKLGQGYTVTEMQKDEYGNVAPVKVQKQYTPEEMEAMLEKMFPNRYVNPQGAPNVGTVQQTSAPVSTDAVVNKWASVFNGNGGATSSPSTQSTTQPQTVQTQTAVPQLTKAEQAELRGLFGIKDEPKPDPRKAIADFRKAKSEYKPYVYQGGANSVSFVNGTRR